MDHYDVTWEKVCLRGPRHLFFFEVLYNTHVHVSLPFLFFLGVLLPPPSSVNMMWWTCVSCLIQQIINKICLAQCWCQTHFVIWSLALGWNVPSFHFGPSVCTTFWNCLPPFTFQLLSWGFPLSFWFSPWHSTSVINMMGWWEWLEKEIEIVYHKVWKCAWKDTVGRLTVMPEWCYAFKNCAAFCNDE